MSPLSGSDNNFQQHQLHCDYFCVLSARLWRGNVSQKLMTLLGAFFSLMLETYFGLKGSSLLRCIFSILLKIM